MFKISHYIFFCTRADSGTYTCEAQNEYGKAESSGDLFVKQGPTFQVRLR